MSDPIAIESESEVRRVDVADALERILSSRRSARFEEAEEYARNLATDVEQLATERDELRAVAAMLWKSYLLPLTDGQKERVRAALGEKS